MTMLMQIYLGNNEPYYTIEGEYTRDTLLEIAERMTNDKDSKSKMREHAQSDVVSIIIQEKCAHCGRYGNAEFITKFI